MTNYEDCYPALAGGICETFYTNDSELAACFRTTPATIEKWKWEYPDFKKQVRTGRRCFREKLGSDVYQRRWFGRLFPRIADNIRTEFNASGRQLARCFRLLRITPKKLERWKGPDLQDIKRIENLAVTKVIEGIYEEFNPDDELLARCLDTTVEQLNKWIRSDYEVTTAVRLARMCAREGDKLLEGLFDEAKEGEKTSEQGEDTSDCPTS